MTKFGNSLVTVCNNNTEVNTDEVVALAVWVGGVGGLGAEVRGLGCRVETLRRASGWG